MPHWRRSMVTPPHWSTSGTFGSRTATPRARSSTTKLRYAPIAIIPGLTSTWASSSSGSVVLAKGSTISAWRNGSRDVGVPDLVDVLEELRQRNLLERPTQPEVTGFLTLVAQITARLDVAGRTAQKRDSKPLAGRLVVDAHRGRIQDFDRVCGTLRIEDRDRKVVSACDLDGAHDERVLRREELVTALVPRRDLVENAMANEPAQYFAEGRDRGQGLGSISARIDDLQATRRCPSRDFPPHAERGADTIVRRPLAFPPNAMRSGRGEG